MTIAVMKTKVETTLAEHFETVLARLPGCRAAKKLRQDAIAAFASAGLPHRRIEEWKYTDLRALTKEAFEPRTGGIFGSQAIAETLDGEIPGMLRGIDATTIIFVDGQHVTGAAASEPRLFEVQRLADALSSMPDWLGRELTRGQTDAQSNPVLALNTAFMTDGAVIRIPDDVAVEKPIHLVFQTSGPEAKAVTTRNIVAVGRNARVTLIETHLSSPGWPRQQNTATHVVVGDGATVTHIKNHALAAGSTHLANWIVRIGAGSKYQPFLMTIGDGTARNQMSVLFDGENASFDFNGAVMLNGQGHADTTLTVDHAVPQCTSRELIKLVLDGRARGIFQGKVIVRPDAQKTDGKQMAQALMLSPDAEFDSKPELEIYADDVVCGHGSTSAEIDPAMMFYCASRGIPAPEARALAIESFVGEAVDKIEHEGVREGMMRLAREWLARS